MEDRVFRDKIEKLRSKERIQMLEIDRVVEFCFEGIQVHSVLDAGTGSAVFAEAFAKTGIAVTGVDINEKMITEAQKHVPTAQFKVGTAESLPYGDGEFDVVFLGHVLHEATSVEKVLEEAKRVAKQRVVVLEWPYKQEEKGPPLAHRLKAEKIVQAAAKAGCTGIEQKALTRMVLFRMKP